MNTSKVNQLLDHAGNYLKQDKPAKADTVCNQLLEDLDSSHEAYPAALHLKGMCCAQRNRLAQGIDYISQAIDLAPENGQFYYSLAVLHFKIGQLEEGISVIDDCADRIRLDGVELEQFAELLMTCHQREAAVRYYRACLEKSPGNSSAWYGLGCAYNVLKSPVNAAECFENALKWGAKTAEAYHNLGQSRFMLGEVNRAFNLLVRAYRLKQDQQTAISIATIVPGASKALPRDILKWRKAVNQFVPLYPEDNPPSNRSLGSKKRIAYLSSFFNDRNWMKPVWGLINEHDRSVFDLHLLSLEGEPPFPGYEQHPSDNVHVLQGRTIPEIVESIRALDIDLLIDLNAYSKVFSLALYKSRLARVVTGWFNWFATSGFDGIDYLIGDPVVIPESEETFYSEKIKRVTGSYITFRVLYAVPDVVAPPSSLQGATGVTFGSLCSLYKITPEVIDSWSRILLQSPGSRLLIRNAGLSDDSSKAWLQDSFGERGIPADRLTLKGRAEHYEFLETYNDIDVALDTFPYNGGTTTTEAIWQGVPVLAFTGDRWAARTSASLLLAGGLDAFVADSLHGLEALAVRLAADPSTPARLKDLRFVMREKLQKSPVCDNRSFARSMEDIYRQMIEEHES